MASSELLGLCQQHTDLTHALLIKTMQEYPDGAVVMTGSGESARWGIVISDCPDRPTCVVVRFEDGTNELRHLSALTPVADRRLWPDWVKQAANEDALLLEGSRRAARLDAMRAAERQAAEEVRPAEDVEAALVGSPAEDAPPAEGLTLQKLKEKTTNILLSVDLQSLSEAECRDLYCDIRKWDESSSRLYPLQLATALAATASQLRYVIKAYLHEVQRQVIREDKRAGGEEARKRAAESAEDAAKACVIYQELNRMSSLCLRLRFEYERNADDDRARSNRVDVGQRLARTDAARREIMLRYLQEIEQEKQRRREKLADSGPARTV